MFAYTRINPINNSTVRTTDMAHCPECEKKINSVEDLGVDIPEDYPDKSLLFQSVMYSCPECGVILGTGTL
jgi:uncharacterized protein with PIN domain